MKNREIFQRDPVVAKLLNDGVAAVREAATEKEIETLRYELEHFVCEGQYEEGLIRILGSYLGNVNSTTQPAAWVSGFFGSGKSHLLKMFRHLWVDTHFADGATARELSRLPQEVLDLLRELDTLGRRFGGLHAASGTLPSGGGESVRLAVLGIVLASKGLPESLPQAQFCLWLQKNGILERVKQSVQAAGKRFLDELHHLYVSPVLAKAILGADPDFASDLKTAREALRTQFPVVKDLPAAEFIRVIRDVLAPDGQIPCTVIALDEIQLFIGNDTDRSVAVQDIAEALCKQLDSRILLIGAGQTALAGGVALLQRLMGRFTVSVELSDADVEAVTRRVVLAKKADRKGAVEEVLAAHAGEIDRQLSRTRIGVRTEDREFIADDYPLLPVRRRFWEHVLRAADLAGTTSQLRTQLKIVHEAVRLTAEEKLGTVVAADFIFEQLHPDLLRSGVLLREIDETIRTLDDGSPDGRLAQRLCGLIFLIRRLPRDAGADIGVRATAEMLADLLISDLSGDGTDLRKAVPRVLKKLAESGTLIKLEDEYSLQTRESSEWDREFRNRQTRLGSDLTALAAKRSGLIGAACGDIVKSIRLTQGTAKVPRTLTPHFGSDAPPTDGTEIPVWFQDGWGERESTVVGDAREAGNDSPVIFVFVPRTSVEDLQKAILEYEAAKATLDFKGIPSSEGGQEARKGMETRMLAAEASRREIIREIIGQAKVFQGGGSEGLGLDLQAKLEEAARASLDRLFPRFRDGDDKRWSSVINRAKNGDDAALTAVDWNDAAEKHPVCAAILSEVGAGKQGKEIRGTFEASPYGWPRDAVDAALIVLHATGHLRAILKGTPIPRGQLDQNKIPVADFRAETFTLDASQRMKLRKLFQTAGPCSPGEESAKAPQYLSHLLDLASRAGGDPPLPPRPNTAHLERLRGLAGTEQLAAILEERDLLARQAEEWGKLAELAEKRLPAWQELQRLLKHAESLSEGTALRNHANAVEAERRLLDATDPVPVLRKNAVGVLRAAVNAAHAAYEETYAKQTSALATSEIWKELTEDQRQALLGDKRIQEPHAPAIGRETELLAALEQTSLPMWRAKTDALPQQFARTAQAAAKLLEPKAQYVHLTSGTLRTKEDVKAWLVEKERELLAKLSDGPVVVS